MIDMPMDKSMPPVPREIFDLALDDADLTYTLRCQELWVEVLDECLDTEYRRRTHHNVGTYDQGCRGPLCRKALREHPKRKRGVVSSLTLREERIYDPVLEYFHVVARHRYRKAQQEIIQHLRESTV